jgi:hypothetical protein
MQTRDKKIFCTVSWFRHVVSGHIKAWRRILLPARTLDIIGRDIDSPTIHRPLDKVPTSHPQRSEWSSRSSDPHRSPPAAQSLKGRSSAAGAHATRARSW